MEVAPFVIEFAHTYFAFSQEGMILSDAVMAFMLLASFRFSEQETQLVTSAITDVTYDNIKAAVKRIFTLELLGNPCFWDTLETTHNQVK